MSELFVEQIKTKNWARRWKRTKRLLAPRPFGYESRGGGGGGTGKSTNQAADDIRKMFEKGQ